MIHHHTRILTLAAIASAAILTSCSARAPSVKEDIKTTLANYTISEPQEFSLAVDRSIEKCMQDAGLGNSESLKQYKISAQLASLHRSDENLLTISGNSLMTSEDDARAGYYSTFTNDEAALRNFALSKGDTSATLDIGEYQQTADDVVLYGAPDKISAVHEGADGSQTGMRVGGCKKQALEAVYGSVQDYMVYTNFFNDFNGGAFNTDAEAYSKVEKALEAPAAQWSKCMKEAGYEVKKLEDAAKLAAEKFGEYRLPNTPASADETSMAITDYRCQKEAKFAETEETAVLEVVASWANDNEAKIMQIRDIEQVASANAQKILNS